MDEKDFKNRTKQLALRNVRLVENLPRNRTADVIGKQLLRSALSIAANYRAACRGKSPSDMVAKLAIVEEKTDEVIFWLEMLDKTRITSPEETQAITSEANEILAMTVSSIKT